MNKKYLAIGIIIIALALVGAYFFMSSSSSVEVGKSTFKLPDKFTVSGNKATKDANVVSISSDNTLLKVGELKSKTSLNSAVKKFTNSKNDSTVKATNFDAGNTNIKAKKVVCRTNSTGNDTNSSSKVTVRYYATKGNSTYYVESTSNNKSIDAIVRDILSTITKTN